MKKCPLCNAEIAIDLANCGNHNTVVISMSDNPIADALAAARMQLNNRIQALTASRNLLGGLSTQVILAQREVAKAQEAVNVAQSNVDTLQKFIGGTS